MISSDVQTELILAAGALAVYKMLNDNGYKTPNHYLKAVDRAATAFIDACEVIFGEENITITDNDENYTTSIRIEIKELKKMSLKDIKKIIELLMESTCNWIYCDSILVSSKIIYKLTGKDELMPALNKRIVPIGVEFIIDWDNYSITAVDEVQKLLEIANVLKKYKRNN